MRLLPIALATLFLCTSASAQWLKQPTQGIPRLADGTPNLAAPPPRTADGKPDLSGLWSIRVNTGYLANVAADLQPNEVLPWAATLFRQRLEEYGKDDPGTIGCLPTGPRQIISIGLSQFAKIIQTPTVIVLLFEDLAYRQIFMDGRGLPIDPNPSFMGYSVGRWEADELVVDSAGFNDRTWLDYGGHPHTESLRITERYRRVDFGHIQRRVTVEDPKTFTKPITTPSDLVLAADTELLETVCAENSKGTAHLVGRTSEERNVKIAAETLGKYVGAYYVEGGTILGARRLDITLSEGELLLDFDGKGKVPLVPLSELTFSPRLGGTYEFVLDGQGIVTHLLAHGAGSFVKAVRKDSSSVAK